MADNKKPPPPEASAATLSPARASPSRTIRENVHTSVLGRDAGDSEHFSPSRHNASTTAANSSNRRYARSSPSKATTTTKAETSKSPTAPYQAIQSPPRPTSPKTLYAENRPDAPMDSNDNDPSNNNNNNSRWWGGRLFGGSEDGTADVSMHSNRKRRSGNARYDGLDQSPSQYDPPTVASSSNDSAVVASSVATAGTREDQVRENCSYFYRGMEGAAAAANDPSAPMHKTRTHRGTGRTAAAANTLLRRLSVRARLSGEIDGALFMSEYERLNQVLDSPPRRKRNSRQIHVRGQHYTGNDNNEQNHELFLDEETAEESSSSYREHIPSPTNNVVMTATSLGNGVRSSMFFEQDGRMLMRLPRDQVRLVMDYNLEPGIISVEQWRSQVEAEASSSRMMMDPFHVKMARERERRKNVHRRRKEKQKRRRRRQKRKESSSLKSNRDESHKSSDENLQNVEMDDPLTTMGGGQLPPLESLPLENPQPRKTGIEDYFDSEDSYDDNDDDSFTSSDGDDDDTYLEYDLEMQDMLPELKYVITVPDDLYRRMVREMSANAFPPFWGFFKCCNQESERADIRLALVILTVVMLLLFAGSLEWRTT